MWSLTYIGTPRPVRLHFMNFITVTVFSLSPLALIICFALVHQTCSDWCTSISLARFQTPISTWMACACVNTPCVTSNGDGVQDVVVVGKDWESWCFRTSWNGIYLCGFDRRYRLECLRYGSFHLVTGTSSWRHNASSRCARLFSSETHHPCGGKFCVVLCTAVPQWESLFLWRHRLCDSIALVTKNFATC